MYKDPLPHPALREGVVPKLLSFVDRAMAIAQLTHLRISIPASGTPPGKVPADCFPGVVRPTGAAVTRRVSFAPEESTLEIEMTPAPANAVFPSDSSDVTVTGDRIELTAPPVSSFKTVSPPPGFPQFSWPQEDWMLSGDPVLDPGLQFVTSWSTRILQERTADLPSLPLSPIAVEGSRDSITAQLGSSTDETITPVRVVKSHADHHKRHRKEYSAPSEDFLFKNVLWAPAVNVPRQFMKTDGGRTPRKIPQWWLAREGPFLNERSAASIRVMGPGCPFRHTTYSEEDHALPLGGFGVPLNHPRFLEWVGAPDSAKLLEMSPGQWVDSLSRDKAMSAAAQLHQDACLMNTNLNILEQYALSLHGAASKILEKTIGGDPYPAAAVAAGAKGPRARHTSVQM